MAAAAAAAAAGRGNADAPLGPAGHSLLQTKPAVSRRPVGSNGSGGGAYFAVAASGSVQAITLSPGLVSMRSWPPIAATMYCLPSTV